MSPVPSYLIGIIIVRATRDANNNMALISVSRFLAAESDLSVGAHINAEIDILGREALNRSVSPNPPPTLPPPPKKRPRWQPILLLLSKGQPLPTP